MPLDVKDACFEMYQKLYKWHTDELEKLELKLKQSKNYEECKRIKIVQKRLAVERKRIRKIYLEEFSEDKYDSLLGIPTKRIR